MQEFPLVRYRAARSAAANSTATTTARDLVPTKIAAGLWERLMKYKSSLQNFPQSETCELIIVDRSVDPVFVPRFPLRFLRQFFSQQVTTKCKIQNATCKMQNVKCKMKKEKGNMEKRKMKNEKNENDFVSMVTGDVRLAFGVQLFAHLVLAMVYCVGGADHTRMDL